MKLRYVLLLSSLILNVAFADDNEDKRRELIQKILELEKANLPPGSNPLIEVHNGQGRVTVHQGHKYSYYVHTPDPKNPTSPTYLIPMATVRYAPGSYSTPEWWEANRAALEEARRLRKPGPQQDPAIVTKYLAEQKLSQNPDVIQIFTNGKSHAKIPLSDFLLEEYIKHHSKDGKVTLYRGAEEAQETNKWAQKQAPGSARYYTPDANYAYRYARKNSNYSQAVANNQSMIVELQIPEAKFREMVKNKQLTLGTEMTASAHRNFNPQQGFQDNLTNGPYLGNERWGVEFEVLSTRNNIPELQQHYTREVPHSEVLMKRIAAAKVSFDRLEKQQPQDKSIIDRQRANYTQVLAKELNLSAPLALKQALEKKQLQHIEELLLHSAVSESTKQSFIQQNKAALQVLLNEELDRVAKIPINDRYAGSNIHGEITDSDFGDKMDHDKNLPRGSSIRLASKIYDGTTYYSKFAPFVNEANSDKKAHIIVRSKDAGLTQEQLVGILNNKSVTEAVPWFNFFQLEKDLTPASERLVSRYLNRGFEDHIGIPKGVWEAHYYLNGQHPDREIKDPVARQKFKTFAMTPMQRYTRFSNPSVTNIGWSASDTPEQQEQSRRDMTLMDEHWLRNQSIQNYLIRMGSSPESIKDLKHIALNDTVLFSGGRISAVIGLVKGRVFDEKSADELIESVKKESRFQLSVPDEWSLRDPLDDRNYETRKNAPLPLGKRSDLFYRDIISFHTADDVAKNPGLEIIGVEALRSTNPMVLAKVINSMRLWPAMQNATALERLKQLLPQLSFHSRQVALQLIHKSENPTRPYPPTRATHTEIAQNLAKDFYEEVATFSAKEIPLDIKDKVLAGANDTTKSEAPLEHLNQAQADLKLNGYPQSHEAGSKPRIELVTSKHPGHKERLDHSMPDVDGYVNNWLGYNTLQLQQQGDLQLQVYGGSVESFQQSPLCKNCNDIKEVPSPYNSWGIKKFIDYSQKPPTLTYIIPPIQEYVAHYHALLSQAGVRNPKTMIDRNDEKALKADMQKAAKSIADRMPGRPTILASGYNYLWKDHFQKSADWEVVSSSKQEAESGGAHLSAEKLIIRSKQNPTHTAEVILMGSDRTLWGSATKNMFEAFKNAYPSARTMLFMGSAGSTEQRPYTVSDPQHVRNADYVPLIHLHSTFKPFEAQSSWNASEAYHGFSNSPAEQTRSFVSGLRNNMVTSFDVETSLVANWANEYNKANPNDGIDFGSIHLITDNPSFDGQTFIGETSLSNVDAHMKQAARVKIMDRLELALTQHLSRQLYVEANPGQTNNGFMRDCRSALFRR